MKKQEEKTGDLIDKKPPKLNEKIRRKTEYLFAKVEKPLKPNEENKEENWVLILKRWVFGVLDQRLEYNI